MGDIGDNVESVRARIATAAGRAGRDADEIVLMAVSKTVDPRRIDTALEAGIRVLGESRVQEAEEKIPRVAGEASWHLVGRLQSNKARLAAALFDAVHSVDDPALAERLARVAGDRESPLGIYVQVEAGAALGAGVDDAVRETCRTVAGADTLALEGLMVMPPYDPDPEAARPCFQGLRGLRDRLRERDPGLELPGLSMGMSGDYEVAVEEGATIVRVGTAIFGSRPA